MSQKNFPRLNLRQVLVNDSEHPARFYAVLLDPEKEKRFERVLIFEAQPGELIELGVERETVFAGSDEYYEKAGEGRGPKRS